MAKRAVEEEYKKVDQVEHILIRPDTYVGSIEMTDPPTLLWIFDEETKKFDQKEIEYVPALYKIFDEILVNAADNYQRHKNTTTIKVTIDKATNKISVWNDGNGIPVQIHKEHNIYVPELIFGHLLAGNNFDDTQKKVVGGRNGYGAKLTNIFSKTFIVETADKQAKKKFKKVWKNNMSESTPCEIKDFNGTDFTCITFQPDLQKFKMQELDNNIMALFKKRVYDLAGIFSKQIKVYYNDEKIQINSFGDYVDLYLPNTTLPKLYDSSMKNDRWEVLISFSDGKFEQCSFVNSICTSKGGTHVKYIADQLVKEIKEKISKDKKCKGMDIKSSQIQQHLWIFVNCLIENPAFDSQTKETLTTKPKDFGSKCELSEKLIKNVMKSGVVEQIVQHAKVREQSKLGKTIKAGKRQRINDIEKLEDANDAGTRFSENCTLILTEGDSAKSLAMAGIEIIGRDKYGVFPLKGKLLNIREATAKQIQDNKEIQNLVKILGLNKALKYESENDRKTLRYGSIMIMADQDHDGSHIKGLVINFIDTWWPDLIKQNQFIKEFATPILKVFKGQQELSFFTISDYKRWAEVTENSYQWKVKYYKGLGTSNQKEAKDYFSDLQKHKFSFRYETEEDRNCIDLVFNRNKADDRKNWLANYNPNLCLDHDQKIIRYQDFINKEFIHFSNSDNVRSIPSLCDGMKPGQRKILFSCFKRNLIREIKVAQLSGYVSEHSAYHHGEMSLQSTITGMAQNFVGSNNINLLMPNGQFGTRAQGGKDHASARYVFTQLNKVTRYIFPEPDDHLLEYLEDDGQMVEPKWYIPIIPMCLINGADGIGTGWSTSIPNYNPRAIAEMIKQRLHSNEPFQTFHPWFKGYKGDIIPNGSGYIINGTFEIDEENPDIINVTELPIRKWTKDYKGWLQEIMESDQNELQIEDFKEYHANNGIHFQIFCKSGFIDRFRTENEVVKQFKLGTTLQTTNLTLFDKDSKLKKYQSVNQILEEFFQLRLEYYQKRKNYLISKLQRDKQILENKVNFIMAIISDQLKIKNVKKVQIAEQLQRLGFTQFKNLIEILSTKLKAFGDKKNKKKTDDDESGSEDEEEKSDNEERQHNNHNQPQQQKKDLVQEYNYLLKMPIFSLTYEKVEDLKEELKKKDEELKKLEIKQINDMWDDDLNKFLEVLDKVEIEEENELKKAPKNKQVDKNIKAKKLEPKKVIKKRILEKENYNTLNQVKKSRVKKPKQEGGEADTTTTVIDQNEENSQSSNEKKQQKKQQQQQQQQQQKPKELHEQTLMERLQQKYQFMREKPENINENSFGGDSLFDFQYKKNNQGFNTKKFKTNVIGDDDEEEGEYQQLIEEKPKKQQTQQQKNNNVFSKNRNLNIFSEEDSSEMVDEDIVIDYKGKIRTQGNQKVNYNQQIVDDDDDFIVEDDLDDGEEDYDDKDEDYNEDSDFNY